MTNGDEIIEEFIQLYAVMDYFNDNFLCKDSNNKQIYNNKMEKLEKYMEISKKIGTLNEQ